MEEVIRASPAQKSTQLAKSFKIPKEAFTIIIAPKTIKIYFERSSWFPKIRKKPANKSKIPNIFINLFFKLKFHLKSIARVAQSG